MTTKPASQESEEQNGNQNPTSTDGNNFRKENGKEKSSNREQQCTKQTRPSEESVKGKRSFSEVIAKKINKPKPQSTGFWDEAIAEKSKTGSRKRKPTEEIRKGRKLPRERISDSNSDMEQESRYESSNDDEPNYELDPDDDLVPYTRHGVQRFRKRRG